MWPIAISLARPLFLLWGGTSIRSSRGSVRPTGPLKAIAEGADADHILLVGDTFSIAVGVPTHDLGLAGHLARRLSALTGRGADIDIIASDTVTSGTCGDRIDSVDLSRYDALILVFGSNEARRLATQRAWRRHLAGLLDNLATTGASIQIFVCEVDGARLSGAYPRPFAALISQQVRSLNHSLRTICDSRTGVTCIEGRGDAGNTDDEPDRPSSLAPDRVYEHWAGRIATVINTTLDHLPVSGPPSQRADEAARQRSLDALNMNRMTESRFDRITHSARSAFDASGAAVVFIDRTRNWVKSSSGLNPEDTRHLGEFCDRTIRNAERYLVEDATAGPQLREHPGVVGIHRIRFSAGYPIESPDGSRVGALCIVDHRRRSFSHSEAALLRDLALQVQVQLWAGEPTATQSKDHESRPENTEGTG